MTAYQCAQCGARLTLSQVPAHLADTGDATVLPVGACPALFARRNGRPVECFQCKEPMVGWTCAHCDGVCTVVGCAACARMHLAYRDTDYQRLLK